MKTHHTKWQSGTLTTICTHQRDPARGRACCGANGGAEFRSWLKIKLKEQNRWGTNLAVSSGCVGVCDKSGVSVTVSTSNQRKNFLISSLEQLEQLYKEEIEPILNSDQAG